jgi:PIN like domain
MPTLQRVLYVENNVGVAFTEAFNKFSDTHQWGAQFQNWVHPNMQRAQTGDEWWLKQIAGLGYALLTCDLAITESESERDVVRQSGLRYAGFASAQYDGWTQMRAVATHWEALAREFEQGGPVIVKLYKGSTAPEVTRL